MISRVKADIFKATEGAVVLPLGTADQEIRFREAYPAFATIYFAEKDNLPNFPGFVAGANPFYIMVCHPDDQHTLAKELALLKHRIGLYQVQSIAVPDFPGVEEFFENISGVNIVIYEQVEDQVS